ncbi:pilus assembly protein PilM [bacterium]|nr:pilus assembly protein PilM [bacterium]
MKVFWSKKVPLGLDVGGHSVKFCSLETSGASCTVSHGVLCPARTQREAELTGAALGQRIHELMGQIAQVKSGSHWRIYLALAGPSLSAGYLEFPALTAAQLEVAIPTAVAREIPHPLSEVRVFTVPVAAAQQAGGRGIFFVAAPKSALDAQTKMLSQTGLEIAGCEPALLAMIRGLTRNQPQTTDEVCALVSCGFRTTTVVLLKGGSPYFSRDFRIAGSDFTYAFQMGQQVSWAEAEEMKLAYDVGEKDFHIESFVHKWLGEVKRSLDYAAKKFPHWAAQRVVLTGGSALWKGLPERLGDFLQLPVARQQWQKLKASSATSPSDIVLYDTALGLVCRS